MKKIGTCLLAMVMMLVFSTTAFAQNILHETDFSGEGGWFPEMWQSGDIAQITAVDGNDTVFISASSDNDVRFCREFDVEPNSVYGITCSIKTQDVQNGNGANISILNSFAASEGVFGTNDWQKISLTGKTADDQNKITVCLRMGGYSATSIGKAWFDDFKIEKISDATGLTVADFSEFNTSAGSDGNAAEENFTEVEGASIVHHPTAQEVYNLLTMFIALAVVLIAVGFACYWFFIREESCITKGRTLFNKQSSTPIIGILIGAFLLRLILALCIEGYYFDVNCFKSWGIRAAEVPLKDFYDIWCDYPPGYLYVLAFMTNIAKLFNNIVADIAQLFNANPYYIQNHIYMFVIKLPAILCDLAATYLVYRLAKKNNMTKAVTYTLTAFVAFSPVMAFISGAWAQIDSVLTMLLIASAMLLSNKKLIWAGLVYGISIVVKPQALMVGPIYALVYLMFIIDCFTDTKSVKECIKTCLKTLGAVLAAFGVIFILFMPFFPVNAGEGFFDYLVRLATEIYNKYFSTLGGYDYATIEAYNLFGLVGANWKSSAEIFAFGLSFKQFGTLMMAVSVLASWVLYIFGRKKNRYCIFLVMAFLLFSLFIFGHYMHERYLAPVLLLTMVALCGYKDRRLFMAFVLIGAGLLVNVLGAFTIIYPVVDGNATRAGWENYDNFIVAGSIINLAAYAFFAYTAAALTWGTKAFSVAPQLQIKKQKNQQKNQQKSQQTNQQKKKK